MIENVAERLSEWRARDFGGCTREELRSAARHLEISIGPNESIESLTRKLLTHFGQWSEKPTTKKVPRSKTRTPPSLRSLSNWQGKRRRVKLHAQDRARGGTSLVPILWEGEVYYLDPKKNYQDVPWPVYENIRNAVASELVMDWDQKAKVMIKEWTEYHRYPFSDLGDTPSTEDLPTSLMEWYQRDAIAHDYYAEEDRDSLERIWYNLTDGNRPNDKDRDRNTDFWRREILQLLALTPEQLEAA